MATHLSGFTGAVHADGFNGLPGEDEAQEPACPVHMRRKFSDELECNDSDSAKGAMEQVAQVYAIKKSA